MYILSIFFSACCGEGSDYFPHTHPIYIYIYIYINECPRSTLQAFQNKQLFFKKVKCFYFQSLSYMPLVFFVRVYVWICILLWLPGTFVIWSQGISWTADLLDIGDSIALKIWRDNWYSLWKTLEINRFCAQL